MQQPSYKLIHACVINPLDDHRAQWIKDGLLVLKKSGINHHLRSAQYKVDYLGDYEQGMKLYERKRSVKLYHYPDSVIVPSFNDLHFHWVQDDVSAMKKEALMVWLEKYAWPFEKKFADRDYTQKRALNFKNKLLQVGTLGGAIYGSIHPSTVVDAKRFFVGDYIVGNVLMTMNSPADLVQSEEDAIGLVDQLAKKYKRSYAVTPRFAPTVSPEVMKAVAKLARKNRSYVQTHLSENHDEIRFVLNHFKKYKSMKGAENYAEIYDWCNLIGPQTIFGHGIHLDGDELRLINRRGASIAHCPTSNAPIKELGLGSGLFDFRKIEKHHVPWALASDIGGGPFLSMIDVINSFVEQNKKAQVSGATYVKALYRATLAGAKILGRGENSGNLQPKKWANFITLPISQKLKEKSCAEEILRELFSPMIDQREKTLTFVERTFYRGKVVFS